ncbi:MAG: hypothetical protein O7A04_02700, partial [Acidobacteria bacterium]|nr:hypothetical protein [Acidobacteriota bacterium]
MTPTAYALTTVPVLLFLSPLTGRAQELITDRPDFTESAVVVPAGSIQIEGGLTWVDDGGSQGTLSGPEILLRWGLGDRFELRIGLPDYVEPRRGPSGVGDAS